MRIVLLLSALGNSFAPARNAATQLLPGKSKWDGVAREAAHQQGLAHETDKVWHGYGMLYGALMIPLSEAGHRVKMLEIGLGCKLHHNASSLPLWVKLFPPPSEVWEAEYDGDCVSRWQTEGKLRDAAGVMVGDQANRTTLARWITQSGGDFDVIIDDGGHTNVQIWNTFDVLFHEALLPGGIYFIEDLLVGRTRRYEDSQGKRIMADVLKSWVDQLATPPGRHNTAVYEHPIPPDVQMVTCAASHCAIHKREMSEVAQKRAGQHQRAAGRR